MVIITRKGLFTKGDYKEDKWKRVKKLSIFSYLPDVCKIKDGTVLKDIFNIVDSYKLLKIFIQQYSGCRAIEEFHSQAKEPISNEQDDLKYLEIYWTADLSKYKNETSFDISAGFHGVGEKSNKFSMSYSPVNEYAHLPLKLDKKIELFEPFQKDKEPNKLFEAEKEFTLLEVLNAIYWDISFMGGPKENKEFLEEMKRRSEEIRNGTVELIPLEEVLKRLEEEEEKEE